MIGQHTISALRSDNGMFPTADRNRFKKKIRVGPKRTETSKAIVYHIWCRCQDALTLAQTGVQQYVTYLQKERVFASLRGKFVSVDGTLAAVNAP